MEIVNGRITTDWIDQALVKSNASSAKLMRLGKDIREIHTDKWPLRLNNIGKKIRIFLAWFLGRSHEQKQKIAGEYIKEAQATSNQITELLNSANKENAELKGLGEQIVDVIAQFTKVQPTLSENQRTAKDVVSNAILSQTVFVTPIGGGEEQ